MGLAGASAATAGMTLTGCSAVRKPVEKILPYGHRPEDLVPGKPMYFATAMNVGGSVYGLLVTSQDGRPTKIDGNPMHPMSLGAANSWAQASVMDIYDADRATAPVLGGKKATMEHVENAVSALSAAMASGNGEGVAMLLDHTPSPTLRAQLEIIKAKYPSLQLYSHDPAHTENSSNGASVAGGAQAMHAVYNLSAANVVVTVDADILGTEGDSIRHSKDYAAGRKGDKPGEAMNRLYSVEANFSVTGAAADHRLRLKSADAGEFLLALARQLGAKNTPEPAALSGRATKWVQEVANDLLANRGKALVVVGSRQPAQVHALGHLINQQLAGIGKTVHYVANSGPETSDIATLCNAMLVGTVKHLVILGGNPVYTAPADLMFEAALSQVNSIYLGYRYNETARSASLLIPHSHFLESWGDLAASDGTSTIQQPLIQPLYPSWSPIELLGRLAGSGKKTGYELVKGYWASRSSEDPASKQALADAKANLEKAQKAHEAAKGADAGEGKAQAIAAAKANVDKAQAAVTRATAAQAASAKQAETAFESSWRKWLHDGLVENTRTKPLIPTFTWGGLSKAWKSQSGGQGLELNFVLDNAVYDGRWTNNPWLQEAPDPITKLTWDNAALLSPATAKKLGVASKDQIVVSAGGRQVRIAAWVTKGVADDTVIIPLGYGRTQGGRTASGCGFNGGTLRQSATPWFMSGASVKKMGGTYALAVTQTYDSLTPPGSDKKRTMIREATLAEWAAKPDLVNDVEVMPKDKLKSLWHQPNETEGNQWGMTIDLNSCTGCGACTVACQAENNIPVVGKDEVLNGRELHWIRIDRYFDGTDDDIRALVQPMGCVQCETAPCENVCPVGATAHSPEGLNDMAYNRCIGTRYCANNCPYKVRRFNFYNYNQRNEEQLGDLIQLQRNPDVTVRFRGVIEKCSYCVQRITSAKIKSKRNGEDIVPDGEIVTACQQTCPTNAITFGNINDENSAVAKSRANPRNYAVLAELNIHPRTTYLARLTNPNPALSKAGS